ncbi:PREDICTED: translation initiation factor IF-2-like [Myotis brandtii]|uniref:translation initiation factor IF-2-like n=1 Tax=Myotis brandtii TaxID=109478 RepID=UPI000703CF6A|nr:PREDICTED: translation initiation factor IF-2-like [Myotis brandtii]
MSLGQGCHTLKGPSGKPRAGHWPGLGARTGPAWGLGAGRRSRSGPLTAHSPHLPILPGAARPWQTCLIAEGQPGNQSGQWARPRAEEVTMWKEPAGNQRSGPQRATPWAPALHLPSSHKAGAGRQGYQGGASSGLQTGQDPTSLAPGGGEGRAWAQARPWAASWSRLSEAQGTGGGTSPTSCPAAAEAAVPGTPGASWPPYGLPWRSVAGAVGSSRQPSNHCSALKAGGQRWPSLPEASCLESREEAHSAAARPPTGRRDQGRKGSSSRLPGPRGSASRDHPPKACFQPRRPPWGHEGCWRRAQVLWPGSPRLAMPMSLLLGKAHRALTPASAQGQEMPN